MMLRRFMHGFAVLLTLLPFCASAQSPVQNFVAPWNQVGNTVALSASVVSSNAQLGWVAAGSAQAPPSAWVCNTGSVAVYVRVGGASVTVTTATGTAVQPNGCVLLAINGNTYLAAITASSTATLQIGSGSGSPVSSGSGSGGAVAGLAVPHVPDNTTLAALAAASFPQGIWRDHYVAGGTDGPAFFGEETGTCAANGFVNDGVRCTNAADGNSFLAAGWQPVLHEAKGGGWANITGVGCPHNVLWADQQVYGCLDVFYQLGLDPSVYTSITLTNQAAQHPAIADVIGVNWKVYATGGASSTTYNITYTLQAGDIGADDGATYNNALVGLGNCIEGSVSHCGGNTGFLAAINSYKAFTFESGNTGTDPYQTNVASQTQRLSATSAQTAFDQPWTPGGVQACGNLSSGCNITGAGNVHTVVTVATQGSDGGPSLVFSRYTGHAPYSGDLGPQIELQDAIGNTTTPSQVFNIATTYSGVHGAGGTADTIIVSLGSVYQGVIHKTLNLGAGVYSPSATDQGLETANFQNGVYDGGNRAYSASNVPAAANLSNGVTGSGAVVLNTSPVFLTGLTSPAVYGGSAVASSLLLQATSNASPAGDVVTLQGGNINLAAKSGISTIVNIGTAGQSGATIAVAGASSGAQAWKTGANASGTFTAPNGTNDLSTGATAAAWQPLASLNGLILGSAP